MDVDIRSVHQQHRWHFVITPTQLYSLPSEASTVSILKLGRCSILVTVASALLPSLPPLSLSVSWASSAFDLAVVAAVEAVVVEAVLVAVSAALVAVSAALVAVSAVLVAAHADVI